MNQNFRQSGTDGNGGNFLPAKLSQFTATAETIALFEIDRQDGNVTAVGEIASTAGRGPDTGGGAGYLDLARYATGRINGKGTLGVNDGNVHNIYPEGRHLEGANYAFADGHVKWLKGSAVSAGASNPNSNCPQDRTGATCTTTSNDTAAGTDAPNVGATFSLN